MSCTRRRRSYFRTHDLDDDPGTGGLGYELGWRDRSVGRRDRYVRGGGCGRWTSPTTAISPYSVWKSAPWVILIHRCERGVVLKRSASTRCGSRTRTHVDLPEDHQGQPTQVQVLSPHTSTPPALSPHLSASHATPHGIQGMAAGDSYPEGAPRECDDHIHRRRRTAVAAHRIP